MPLISLTTLTNVSLAFGGALLVHSHSSPFMLLGSMAMKKLLDLVFLTMWFPHILRLSLLFLTRQKKDLLQTKFLPICF